MGREAKRVPVGFGWARREVWEGYLMPEWLKPHECPECDGQGWSPDGMYLHGLWYGNEPFRPEDNGSTPHPVDAPAVVAVATRNVEYSRGNPILGLAATDVNTECARLAALWNRRWRCHLNADDIAALNPRGLDTSGSPADFNARYLGVVLGGPEPYPVIKARLAREGKPHSCDLCGGDGYVDEWPGQSAAREQWQPFGPPPGDGWQMWETTSEGSPVSPVFDTAEELARWCTDNETMFGEQRGTYEQWLGIVHGDPVWVEIRPAGPDQPQVIVM